MHVQDVLPKDAIPSIDDPTFGPEYFGDTDDEVIVVDADPPRAYPLRILSAHEIVNDVVDGQPIAVTWCPICWSAAVYDRTVDAQPLTFGVSGKLADDALVMYDRETGTEWQQTTGRAIAGELEGHRLSTFPAPMVSWERFRADNPDGVVLQPARDGSRQSGGESATEAYDMTGYERYVEGEAFGLYGMRGTGEPREWNREDIDAKTLVVGVEHGGEAVGFPLPAVESEDGVVTDSIGGRDIVVFAIEDGVHVVENPGIEFERTNGEIRGDETAWDPVTGESDDGRSLERLPARTLFAFAWQDAHGADGFYS